MRTKLGKLGVILLDILLGLVDHKVCPTECAEEWNKTKENGGSQMKGIINGKAYEFEEYWKKRLEQVIELGCDKESLLNLCVDLSFENLEQPDQAIQVPEVIIHVPLYERDEDNHIIPMSMEEQEVVLEHMEQISDFCGYSIDSVVQSVTYVME